MLKSSHLFLNRNFFEVHLFTTVLIVCRLGLGASICQEGQWPVTGRQGLPSNDDEKLRRRLLGKRSMKNRHGREKDANNRPVGHIPAKSRLVQVPSQPQSDDDEGRTSLGGRGKGVRSKAAGLNGLGTACDLAKASVTAGRTDHPQTLPGLKTRPSSYLDEVLSQRSKKRKTRNLSQANRLTHGNSGVHKSRGHTTAPTIEEKPLP
jgi:hypothetical protein